MRCITYGAARAAYLFARVKELQADNFGSVGECWARANYEWENGE